MFIDFPPVLQLQLKRFEYDFMRDTMVKVSSRVDLNLLTFIVFIFFASYILMTFLSYFYAFSPYFVCCLSTCTKLRKKEKKEKAYVMFFLFSHFKFYCSTGCAYCILTHHYNNMKINLACAIIGITDNITLWFTVLRSTCLGIHITLFN